MWKRFENAAMGNLCVKNQLEMDRRTSRYQQQHLMTVTRFFTFINLESGTFTKVFRFCTLIQDIQLFLPHEWKKKREINQEHKVEI